MTIVCESDMNEARATCPEPLLQALSKLIRPEVSRGMRVTQPQDAHKTSTPT
jgi:hypothetical protein